MPFPPDSWSFDSPSFWLGVAAGALPALLLFLLRGPSSDLGRQVGARLRAALDGMSSGADRSHRADVVRLAESAHLAAPLFKLSKILVEPVLMAPPLPLDPLSSPEPDLFNSLSYLPDWPNLAAAFNVPGLSLSALWATGANVLLTGELGGGKTVALAAIAMRVAQGHPDFGGLDAPRPIFVHAADIPMPSWANPDPASGLVTAAQARASSWMSARLRGTIRHALKRGRALVLIDGADELPSGQLATFASWLGTLLRIYPKARVIVAGPARGYAPLSRLGLMPVTLQAWSGPAHQALIQKWKAAWTEATSPDADASGLNGKEPLLLSSWADMGNTGSTPIELTLKLWAVFAGEVIGPRRVDAIEAYFNRFAPDPNVRHLLERLAGELCRRDLFGISVREAQELGKTILVGHGQRREAAVSNLVLDLLDQGVLARHTDERLAFSHPALAAYLAACQLKSSDQASWALGRDDPVGEAVLQFSAAFVDLGDLAKLALAGEDDLLSTRLWAPARWLRHAPASARWTGEILRALANLFLQDDLPYGRRARAVAALVISQDPGLTQLFRPALTAAVPETRSLAGLGLGAMGDSTAVPALLELLEDSESAVRQAACLALYALGTGPAFEALASALLIGEEGLRRFAAQALARDPHQGHALLREALGEKDHLLRRAAAFGLTKVGEPWAVEALQHVAFNDPELVVRNAADEALKGLQASPVSRFVVKPTLPENLPWLLTWAARQGLGVAPGAPGLATLLRVAREGAPEERQAALETLGAIGDGNVTQELYQAMRDPDPRVRDAAFAALHRLASKGEPLPGPTTPGAN